MSVADSLDRMTAINRRIGEEAALAEVSSDAILGLRHEFTSECGTLLLAMCDDPAIFGNRALFDAWQEELDVLRTRVSGHQLRWQGPQIEQDPAGYARASQAINQAVTAFIAASRARLQS